MEKPGSGPGCLGQGMHGMPRSGSTCTCGTVAPHTLQRVYRVRNERVRAFPRGRSHRLCHGAAVPMKLAQSLICSTSSKSSLITSLE